MLVDIARCRIGVGLTVRADEIALVEKIEDVILHLGGPGLGRLLVLLFRSRGTNLKRP